MPASDALTIVFIASEVAKYASTGGLGDVASSLPKALVQLGQMVIVIAPCHRGTKAVARTGKYHVDHDSGVELIFINHDEYFLRDGLYCDERTKKDWPDNLERFTFFCHEALQFLKSENIRPDIIHAHDWQGSPALILLRTAFRHDHFFAKTRTFLTIHNVDHQGVFPPEKFNLYKEYGVDDSYFNYHELMMDDHLSTLKGGVVFSDWANTVSPNNAREMMTEEGNPRLFEAIIAKGGAFCGILNGIDTDVWNPARDPLLFERYDSKSVEKKKINKTALQEMLGLKVDSDATLIGMVSRLDKFKGIDAVKENLPHFNEKLQIAVLGKGDAEHEKMLNDYVAGDVNRKKFISITNKFDNLLSHRIFAAQDLFWMPSKKEPCGLTNLYAFRYGAAPIVFPSGGLVDSVVDYNDGGCGFVCQTKDTEGLWKATERALEIKNSPDAWRNLQVRAMKLNFSWDRSARVYLSIYKYLVSGIFPVKTF